MEANGLDTSASRFGPGFNLYSLIIRAAVSPDGHPNSPAYGHLKLPHLN